MIYYLALEWNNIFEQDVSQLRLALPACSDMSLLWVLNRM